ncbi:hypothetical protein QYE76_046748 [Lolium multiflorum]|uniref:NAD(P)H dehydrogenase subunit H n=1 Tax=Lolium multiflorum TaxID=4521 RepID=A0AAD8W5A6_LOLMU|nr:hypothetical protein QYE76_059404 [Lolium multiflorum]KAK1685900.1 hypothetical protein QYE76_046748 [Lolium multiflorum]
MHDLHRERELIYDLFEAATERVEGVGFISGEEAVNWGLSGPMLRASGIQWDLRKVDLYESYNQFDWKVQWQKEGDSLARYLVRISEMRESIKIIQQAIEKIPGGPYENLEVRRFKKAKTSEWNDFEYKFLGKKPSPNFELSKQELYVRVEAPKECERLPFDLPEAEEELVAGYQTEYSGIKYALFYLVSYLNLLVSSLFVTVLYLGGWDLSIPYISFFDFFKMNNAVGILEITMGIFITLTKAYLFLFISITIRWTLPRMRMDQLLNLGWKFLLPISLGNLLLTTSFQLVSL